MMDSVRLGRQLRALRLRHRLRQDDVAARAGISRSEVGRAERGQAQAVRLRRLERIAEALGARLDIRVSWNGEALDRLLDAAHADLVQQVVTTLEAAGWECLVEVSFHVRGERGSVDVLARHRSTGSGLVVEAKSIVPDVQATLMTLDRKVRLAPIIARERDRPIRSVGVVLVIADSRTSRRRIERHQAIFDAALPARTVEVRRWSRAPTDPPVRGIWFLPSGHAPSARHRMPAARLPDDGLRARASAPKGHGS
jgi:transcriptional regulator with XRE-family HTH domain